MRDNNNWSHVRKVCEVDFGVIKSIGLIAGAVGGLIFLLLKNK